MYPEQRQIYEKLGKRLEGKTVIDIGCGIGIGTNIMAMYGAVAIGVDIEEKNVRCAQVLYPHLEFSVMDIKKQYYTPPQHTVTAIEIIEHVTDVEIAIKNIIDSATNEIYISTPNRNNPALGQNKPLNDFHVREYTPLEMLEILGDHEIEMFGPDFEEVDEKSGINPIVYFMKL